MLNAIAKSVPPSSYRSFANARCRQLPPWRAKGSLRRLRLLRIVGPAKNSNARIRFRYAIGN
jgi:hypothetical protein